MRASEEIHHTIASFPFASHKNSSTPSPSIENRSIASNPPLLRISRRPIEKMMRTQASSLLRKSLVRSPAVATRAASTHAISNPTLANIEKRWEGMPLQEQADLWMALRDRMKGSWTELTVQEQKAAYWIAFGPHGPRAQEPAGTNAKIAWGVAVGLGVSFSLFALTRYFANPAPHTMTREWQEASNERLLEQKADPITGITSGLYPNGMIQSPPKGH
ncbi:Cytochrome c oxidase subunit 5 [Paramyrothecium foliicola]|nr:Cytochrome c oxidase subunit 5 [Paramyrothecium foliicola]